MTETFKRLLTTLCVTLIYIGGAWAEPAIEGSWQLDEKLSDDPKKVFKGKLRKIAAQTPDYAKTAAADDTSFEHTQQEYWALVKDGNERGSIKDLRRLGTAYPLVKNSHFDISRYSDGYEIVYDRDLPRTVIPNPAGRVFTASGDELVVDTLGHTLAYWDGKVLVIESDPPTGGKVIERLEVQGSPRQLLYSIKMQLRILKEPVEIKRVFQPAGTSALDHSVTVR